SRGRPPSVPGGRGSPRPAPAPPRRAWPRPPELGGGSILCEAKSCQEETRPPPGKGAERVGGLVGVMRNGRTPAGNITLTDVAVAVKAPGGRQAGPCAG